MVDELQKAKETIDANMLEWQSAKEALECRLSMKIKEASASEDALKNVKA